MNWRAISAIVRKDLKVVLQSKGVLIPLIVVPLTLTILLPALLATLPQMFEFGEMSSMSGLDAWLARLPQSVLSDLMQYNEQQRMIVLLVVYYLAPMYLILPLMVASVVAADSIVGERERKTLEALLYTPTTDRELFVAKFMASWIPAMAVAWMGFVMYSVVANVTAWPAMERFFFPTPMWLLLAFWVAPAVAALGLSFVILISVHVDTFQEAYQLGGVVVVPVIALIVGQATGFLVFSSLHVFLMGIVIWVVDGLLLWKGGGSLRRPSLASRV